MFLTFKRVGEGGEGLPFLLPLTKFPKEKIRIVRPPHPNKLWRLPAKNGWAFECCLNKHFLALAGFEPATLSL